MAKKRVSCLLVIMVLISGCINFGVEDEQKFPKIIEVVLITNTPQQLPPVDTVTTLFQTETPVSKTQTAIRPQASITPSSSFTNAPPTSTEVMGPPSLTPMPTNENIPINGKVILNANCRLGPGTVYGIKGYLIQGEQAHVEGRNAASSWWLITKDGDEMSCWVTAMAISLDGSPEILPVVPPPPTPTATFKPSPTVTSPRKPKPPKSTISPTVNIYPPPNP
jgi:uncharacterized protein YraI